MKHTKNTVVKDTAESYELYVYTVNESRVYPQIKAVVNNLARYYKRGVFDAEKAVDAFFYVANNAARLYCKDYGGAPFSVFDVTARYTAAAAMAEYFMEDIENGGI